MEYTDCNNCRDEIDTEAIYEDNSGMEVYWTSEDGSKAEPPVANTTSIWFCEWACVLGGLHDENDGDYNISEARRINKTPFHTSDQRDPCAHCGKELRDESGTMRNHVVGVSNWHVGQCWRRFCNYACLKYGRRVYEGSDAADTPDWFTDVFRGGNAFYTDTPASEASDMDEEDEEEYEPIAENDSYDEQTAIDSVITKLCAMPSSSDPDDMHTLDHYGFAPDAVKVK
jgi:hypothetical protein